MAVDLQSRPTQNDDDQDVESPGQSHYDNETFKQLTSSEHQAKDGVSGNIGQRETALGKQAGDFSKDGPLSGDQLNKFEGLTGADNPWSTLVRGESDHGVIGAVRGVKRRRKIIGGFGITGIVGTALAVFFTVAPIYQLPSLNFNMLNFRGLRLNHALESRAQRSTVTKMLEEAGGLPDGYAEKGSKLDRLWTIFNDKKVTAEVKKKSGLEIKRGQDGKLHLHHGDRDLGPADTEKEVMRLIKADKLAQKAMTQYLRKSVKIISFLRTTRLSWLLKDRFMDGKRYGPPKESEDPNKTKEENQAIDRSNVVKDQASASDGQIRGIVDGANCLTGDPVSCDKIEPGSQAGDANPSESVKERNKKIGDLIQESSSEATDELADAASKGKDILGPDGKKMAWMQIVVKKIVAKFTTEAIGSTVATSIPVLGWIDFMAQVDHGMEVALKNHLAARIPVILKQQGYGGVATLMLGYGDSIKSGNASLSFIAGMNRQLAGGGNATAKYFMDKGEIGKGMLVDPRVGDSLDDPYGDLLSTVYGGYDFLGITWSPSSFIRAPLQVWYATISKAMGLFGDFAGEQIAKLLQATGFSALFDALLKGVFGEDWQQQLALFAMNTVLRVLGISISALDVGAKLVNNIYVGIDVGTNIMAQTMGMRALSDLTQSNILGQAVQRDEQLAMESTPLKDRLFSLDEPESLINKAIIGTMGLNSSNSIPWLVGKIGSIPAMFGSLLTGRASASIPAANVDSSIDGVRQWGAYESDLDRDISIQMRKADNEPCPVVDQTTEFNECLADSATIDTMICIYGENADCPGLNDGSAFNYDGGETTIGLIKNLKQVIDPQPVLNSTAKAGW